MAVTVPFRPSPSVPPSQSQTPNPLLPLHRFSPFSFGFLWTNKENKAKPNRISGFLLPQTQITHSDY
ncbi:hypothetical protein CCACVL1_30965 [Corchorus capsularis]|uniref:Uncharacterized protein n=1 Tax=Corchorus capsularis TaxID=210143 RepID=A0A1R3FUT2_COCAP|nr:hypothetical protein CCACVL1_30965 [Corchorus capsularis]